MKKFVKEFKEFISRGNVLDMAVGIIIGSAFTAIINAVVKSILTPFINWIIYLICGGKEGSFEGLNIYLIKVYDETGALDSSASTVMAFSDLITAVIQFFLIALVLFLIVKAFNKARRGAELAKDLKAKKEAGFHLTKREQKKLDAILAEEAKQKEEEEKKALEEAAKKAQYEAELAKLPNEERLLVEIRDLLKERK